MTVYKIERNAEDAFFLTLLKFNKKCRFKACEDFENRSLVDLNDCLQNRA